MLPNRAVSPCLCRCPLLLKVLIVCRRPARTCLADLSLECRANQRESSKPIRPLNRSLIFSLVVQPTLMASLGISAQMPGTNFITGHRDVVQLVRPRSQRVILVGKSDGKQVDIERTPESTTHSTGQCRFAGHAVLRRHVDASIGRTGVEHEAVRTVSTHLAVRPVQHLEPAIGCDAR